MGKQGPIGDLFRFELKAARLRRGLSQEALARIVTEHYGLPTYASTIAKIESGDRDVRIDELHSFADLFGVSTDALLGRKGSSTDVMWAASRLSGNAQKMVGEVVSLRDRLNADAQDLVDYASREHKTESMQALIIVAREAATGLEQVRQILSALGGQFPLPGVDLDRG